MEFGELLRDASAGELAKIALLAFGIPFALMAVVTWVLKFFMGLTADPDRRAMLTVLPAYVIVTLLFILGSSGLGFFQIVLPLAGLPMAVVIYWWWRREFRAAWLDDSAAASAGIKLENSDWKAGVIAVVSLVLIAAVKVFFIRFA